jgi:hypothetical protein
MQRQQSPKSSYVLLQYKVMYCSFNRVLHALFHFCGKKETNVAMEMSIAGHLHLGHPSYPTRSYDSSTGLVKDCQNAGWSGIPAF